jgi:hypothetical protein
MSSSEVDRSIELTLGNFSDAAPFLAIPGDAKNFIGITTFPTTPNATRQMPPLVYPQPKQSSSAFNSNGLTSSSQSSVTNSSSRTYNNNNNNTINNNNNNNNNTGINNVNSYQPKSSSSTLLQAPPPQSRANSITSSNNNTFVRPSESKPLINGRSGYTTVQQLNKHEVNITFLRPYLFHCTLLSPRLLVCLHLLEKKTFEKVKKVHLVR